MSTMKALRPQMSCEPPNWLSSLHLSLSPKKLDDDLEDDELDEDDLDDDELDDLGDGTFDDLDDDKTDLGFEDEDIEVEESTIDDDDDDI